MFKDPERKENLMIYSRWQKNLILASPHSVLNEQVEMIDGLCLGVTACCWHTAAPLPSTLSQTWVGNVNNVKCKA